ncbi:hypothetical protein HK100_012696, partial [Physocladia obscura]
MSGSSANASGRRASSSSASASLGNRRDAVSDIAAALAVCRNALHVVVNHVDNRGYITRIDNSHYARLGPAGALNAFEADFTALVANAMTYNQIGSDVYKDAKTLQ